MMVGGGTRLFGVLVRFPGDGVQSSAYGLGEIRCALNLHLVLGMNTKYCTSLTARADMSRDYEDEQRVTRRRQ